jgi:hypothetical protein
MFTLIEVHVDNVSKKSNILLIKKINITFYKNLMWCWNIFKNVDLTLISHEKINTMLTTTLKKIFFF